MLKTRPSMLKSQIMDDVQQPKTLDPLQQLLQVETEKIVRWKVSTEVNLHQKERQIESFEKTIKKLRSQLMDGQMTVENLSQNLLKEQKSREILDAKISTTRAICDALQTQQEELKYTLEQCNATREHVSTIHSQSSIDINNLAEHFDQLNIKYENFTANLTQDVEIKLHELMINKVKTEAELKGLQENLTHIREELKLKTEDHAKAISELERAQEKIEILDDGKNQIENEFREYKENSEEKKMQQSEENIKLHETLVTMAQDLDNEKQRAKESQEEFFKAGEKILILKKQNDAMQGKNDELCHQIELLTSKKDSIQNDLDDSCQLITKLQADLQQEKSLLENLHIQYESTKKSLEEKICELKTDSEKMADKNRQLERDIQEIENQKLTVMQEKQQLEEQVSILKTTIMERENTIEENKYTIDSLGKEKEDARKDLDTLKQQHEEQVCVNQSLEKQVKDLEQLHSQALDEVVQTNQLMQKIRMEADAKNKEMVNLLDDYKKENEVILKAKQAEVGALQIKYRESQQDLEKITEVKKILLKDKTELQEQLARQVADHLKLKNDIQNLTVPKTPTRETNSENQIKTPSPSQYLPLYRPSSSYRHRTPQRPPILAEREKPIQGILRPRRNLTNEKKVSFRSPIYMNPPDSDSSDAAMLDFGSDFEDSSKRAKDGTKRTIIPQARITPLGSTTNTTKRIRLEKSMKTYASPKLGKTGNNENKSPKLAKRQTRPKTNSKSVNFDSILEREHE